MQITSLSNDRVKYYTKLMTSKKDRDNDKVFIVEGNHLVSEALRENIVKELIISDSKYDIYSFPNKVYVTSEIMKKICDTVTPQGIIALCEQRETKKLDKLDRVLILDDVRDPGNLGTIIRTADAFKFDGIVMSPTAVDIYNPKVVRSTQGAIFRVKLIKTDLVQYIRYLKSQGVKVFGTALDGEHLSKTKVLDQMAFIMGNEANGVSQELLTLSDKNLYIEMSGESESLNVAVAASIIMYIFRK